MPKIVVPDDWPPILRASTAFRALSDVGEVEYFDTLPCSEHGLIDRIRNAEAVVSVRASSRFTERVFQNCPRVQLVSLFGTGTDNVDIEAAERYGVTITNTPSVSAVTVAEHTLALMLAVARDLPGRDRAVRNGCWAKGVGVELCGKTLGIIGLGAIGRRFAQLGEAIGMRVIAWTMHPNPALGFELVEFERLLRTSDVISLHLRLSPETRSMIGEREFSVMKPTAILLNTARGAIIDAAALLNALSTHQIRGAGLDVFEVEPLPVGDALTKLQNVVLTAHSAGNTPEALEAGLHRAVANVLSFIEGRSLSAAATQGSLLAK
jgi:phosphoglycerate dehydrogenase-like enzyme